MKYALVVLGTIALTACDEMPRFGAGKYTLFETSRGTIYRLDTATGKTELIYTPGGWTTLKPKTIYYGENEKTYEYLGNGKFKELSTTEAADRLLERYTK